MSLPRLSKIELAKISRWLEETTFRSMRWGPKNERSPASAFPTIDRNTGTVSETQPMEADAKDVPESVKLDVNSITVPQGHREIDPGAIDGLADSIRAVGLQHPITTIGGDDGKYVLVAGRHRLEAHRRLGLREISSRIVDHDYARLWSISENLHRVEQSRLDRAEAVMKYAKERGLLEGGPGARPGGKQPHDQGNSRIAKVLGMDRKQVREARAHTEICEEAKKLMRLNGLDNSVKALNAVANRAAPEDQLARAKTLVERQRKPSPRKGTKGAKSGKLHGLANTAAFLELKRQWEALPFKKQFDESPLAARRRFIKEVLSLA